MACRASGVTVEALSAVTLAVHNMRRSVLFYAGMGFALRYGGEQSEFTSFHCGASYLNLILMPAEAQWLWWGRTIFHVDDVDAYYARALALGVTPSTRPCDAAWGERYFHLCDPDGHELSSAKLLTKGGA